MLKISGVTNKATDAKCLQAVCQTYGEVIDSVVINVSCREIRGFVLFDSYEDAVVAWCSLNGAFLNGDCLRIRHFYVPRPMRVNIHFRLLNGGMLYSIKFVEEHIRVCMEALCFGGSDRLQSFEMIRPLLEMNTGIATFEDSIAGRTSACRVLTFLSGVVHAGMRIENCCIMLSASDRCTAHCAEVCAMDRFRFPHSYCSVSPVTVDESLLTPGGPATAQVEEIEEEDVGYALRQLHAWRVNGLSTYWLPSSLKESTV